MKTFKQFCESDYKGEHEAPDPESGSPLHNVNHNGTFPEDFYSHHGFEHYSDHGNSYDHETHRIVTSYHGHPNKPLRVYRAVPADTHKPKINKGDWVAIHRDYAKEHGESNLGGKGKYKIISSQVKARDLFTDGSVHEWGYHPQEFKGMQHEREEKAKAKALRTKLNNG